MIGTFKLLYVTWQKTQRSHSTSFGLNQQWLTRWFPTLLKRTQDDSIEDDIMTINSNHERKLELY